ncbi:MAG: hypothetical protein K6C35_09275 [Eubacterium sp.]|nr:hypothetical protein [Eubacterium sp.]
MGLFGKNKGITKDKEINDIINEIKVDLSNNYKDNAVIGLRKLKETVELKHSGGKLKETDYESCKRYISEVERDLASFKRTY